MPLLVEEVPVVNLKAIERGERIEVGVLGVAGHLPPERCSNILPWSGAGYPRRKELHRNQIVVRPQESSDERDRIDPHVRMKAP